MIHWRRWLYFRRFCFCFSLLFLSSFSIAEEPPVVDGDAFVAALSAEPVNVIPFLASDSASASISGLIFNGLVKYDKNLNLIGDLAESWDVLLGGERIIFHLRHGVLWHDGEPFLADDVVFTYQKIVDPATATPYAGAFEKVESVTAIDPYTVQVNYKEPFSPGLASWGMGIVPKHMLENENIRKSNFSRAPVGTGPYLLKKWKSGTQIELTANPAYYEGKPHISRYVCRIIPENATQFLELQGGNLDAMDLSPLQFEKQTDSKKFKQKFEKYVFPSFGYTYLAYNLKDPLFSDVRVRNAIGLLIRKDEIVRVVLKGMGQVATGPFLPGSWAYNSDVKPSAFDPVKAKQLLEDAGWSDHDGDGFLDKDGKRFSFTLLTNQGNDERKMAAEMIQARLGEAGIDMKIQIVEWGTFLKEFIGPRRFQAGILGWSVSRDPDVFDLFHSSKTNPGEFNFTGFSNLQADILLMQGRRIFDTLGRANVYRELHAVLAKEEPYTFLYVPDSLMTVDKRFQGVELSPAGIGHNFIHWHVPESQQKYRFES